MPRLDGSQYPAQPDYLSERADEDTAHEDDLRAHLLTPAGQAALLRGDLREFLADADSVKVENDGD